MEADEALLDRAVRSGGAFLRLYRWDPPTLSIGRNQAIETVPVGLPFVRRPTGGQAVWHENEVTYAVAAPIEIFGSLRNAYCEIHERLAKALRTMGVEPVLAGRQAPSLRSGQAVRPIGRPASCFSTPVGGEILVHGRKLVGSAQVRRDKAFLQHGSVLLGGSQEKVSVVHNETTLSALLGRAVTFEEVASAIIQTWGESALQPSGVASLAAE